MEAYRQRGYLREGRWHSWWTETRRVVNTRRGNHAPLCSQPIMTDRVRPCPFAFFYCISTLILGSCRRQASCQVFPCTQTPCCRRSAPSRRKTKARGHPRPRQVCKREDPCQIHRRKRGYHPWLITITRRSDFFPSSHRRAQRL